MRLYELHTPKDTVKWCNQFVEWAKKRLEFKGDPKIKYSLDKSKVDQNRTFGSTSSNGTIWVHIGNRNTADVLRTLCHELVHYKQFEDGSAHNDMDDDQHLRIEDEANAIAGRLMREYGKQHVEIYEAKSGSIQQDVAASLPATYVIPELKNQDPYAQYRFGVAIAGAKGAEKRKQDGVPPFAAQSLWNENQVVVSFDPNIGKYIDDALKQLGIKGKKRISTIKSEESPDVPESSPVVAFKGYPR
jgi:hypothetical protein